MADNQQYILGRSNQSECVESINTDGGIIDYAAVISGISICYISIGHEIPNSVPVNKPNDSINTEPYPGVPNNFMNLKWIYS